VNCRGGGGGMASGGAPGGLAVQLADLGKDWGSVEEKTPKKKKKKRKKKGKKKKKKFEKVLFCGRKNSRNKF
jgi:hypothetical protein